MKLFNTAKVTAMDCFQVQLRDKDSTIFIPAIKGIGWQIGDTIKFIGIFGCMFLAKKIN